MLLKKTKKNNLNMCHKGKICHWMDSGRNRAGWPDYRTLVSSIIISQHIRFWYLSHCQATEVHASAWSMCIRYLHTQSMDVDKD